MNGSRQKMKEENRVAFRVIPDKILKNGQLRFSVHFPNRQGMVKTNGWRYDPELQIIYPPAVYYGKVTAPIVQIVKDMKTMITRKAQVEDYLDLKRM